METKEMNSSIETNGTNETTNEESTKSAFCRWIGGDWNSQPTLRPSHGTQCGDWPGGIQEDDEPHHPHHRGTSNNSYKHLILVRLGST